MCNGHVECFNSWMLTISLLIEEIWLRGFNSVENFQLVESKKCGFITNTCQPMKQCINNKMNL